jgi:hypothetical protein
MTNQPVSQIFSELLNRFYFIIHHMQGVNTETLLTVLPVRSSFLTLGHLRVQITDALYLSEPGSLQKLSLFL